MNPQTAMSDMKLERKGLSKEVLMQSAEEARALYRENTEIYLSSGDMTALRDTFLPRYEQAVLQENTTLLDMAEFFIALSVSEMNGQADLLGFVEPFEHFVKDIYALDEIPDGVDMVDLLRKAMDEIDKEIFDLAEEA